MLNYVQDQSEHLMTLQKAFPREYPKYISYQWWKRIPTATIRKVQHANGTKIAYQDMNATMNPNHANVNTLPYTLIGLSAGIERAFWLTGFKSGVFHKSLTSSIFASDKKSFCRRRLLDKASRMCQRTKWSWDSIFGEYFGGSHGVQAIKSNPFNPEQSCKRFFVVIQEEHKNDDDSEEPMPRSEFCGQQLNAANASNMDDGLTMGEGVE